MSRAIVGLLASVCVFASVLSVSFAQEGKEAKPSLKAKGRLPAYYKDVVTPAQKETIYQLQTRYNDQIRKLAEEMKTLTAQRDAEIEAVLTAEQKTKLNALKAEAKKKPAAEATTSAAEPSDAAANDPPKEPAKTTAAKSSTK